MGAEISKDVRRRDSYWSLEVWNFFLAQHSFLHTVPRPSVGHSIKQCDALTFSATRSASHHLPCKHLPVILDCSGITLPFIILLSALALKDISEKLPIQKTLLWLLKCKGLCYKYELCLDIVMCVSLPKIWASINDRVNSLRIYSNYPCSLSLTLNSEKMNYCS